MYQSDVRNDREKLSVPIDMVADTLGKAWKVTDRELQHQKGNISDKALDFINYQFYLTKTKPVWYEGADNQFRE